VGFEVFQRQRAPVTAEPTVTIQKRGNISFNVPAFLALGSPESVELLYDRDERLVAIHKVEPSAPSAYVARPLSQRNRTQTPSSYLVSGIAFTSYYGIPTDVARRWTAHVQDEMLVIDLKEPGVEVASNRARNQGEGYD
jgi:hypothetical protein